MNVTYGPGVAGDDELRLLGDIGGGRRVVELGIAGNAIAVAQAGAKSIVLDPDADRIADLRGAAASAGVSVECHQGELADLGFAPSGTIDLVIANRTLDDEPDLGRTLRQVHRVLKPGAPFVLVMAHPFAPVGTGAASRYGDGHRTVGDLLTNLDRANFRIEAFHELGVDDTTPVPTTLVMKARKQGS